MGQEKKEKAPNILKLKLLPSGGKVKEVQASEF